MSAYLASHDKYGPLYKKLAEGRMTDYHTVVEVLAMHAD
jgi:hypothetical protein